MSCFKMLIALAVLGSAWSGPVDAAELREALMLEGAACSKEWESVREALLKISGITRVDATSVPGYLLIDMVAGTVTTEELANTVTRLYGGKEYCLGEPMQSCISPSGQHSAEHRLSSLPAHR